MKHPVLLIGAAAILYGCSNPVKNPVPTSAFPLKTYVGTVDRAYRYEIVDNIRGASWNEYRIRMVSGRWLSTEEVDEPEWWHWLTMIVPDRVSETESLMLIGGGWRGDTVPPAPSEQMIQAALATRSVISYVSNIPFQPIDYKGDTLGGLFEDDLIAFAWLQFLQGGATEEMQKWLPRFPMTRAVVRAMDVVQEINGSNGKEVDGFFVAGASKRGWTTWDVAAADERVVGISPVVIDLLNIIPSFQHHWQCYGEWSPAIDPYVKLGIMDWMGTEAFQKMLDLVEPYQFRERLTMPKLLINAACDEFFVTDSWRFYWNDLEGDKYLQYVPNAGHGLHGSYLPENLVSFYQYTISGTEMPAFQWNIRNDTIFVRVDPASDYQIRKWEAINEEGRDFRLYVVGEDAWKMEALDHTESGAYIIPVSAPEKGYKGAMVEMVFNPGSPFPLTFTTGTLVTPDTYPYDPFIPDLSSD